MDFKLTLTQRHIDALCATYGRQEKIPNEKGEEVANPVSAEDFALSCITNYIDEMAKSYEINIAVNNARAAVMTAQKGEPPAIAEAVI